MPAPQSPPCARYRVAQPLHEHVERAADALQAPAGFGRSRREAEARQRGNHDVEGVFRACAIPRRIGERLDELDLFGNGARPAMRNEQCTRILVRRANVDEMEVDTVDVRRELRQAIELRLRLPPVIAAAPVLNQALQPRQLWTECECSSWLLAE